MSNKINLVFEKGTDFEGSWIWKDSNKQPIPMNNWTAVLEIKKAPHLAAVLTLTEGAGITLGDSDGKIEVEVTKAQIDALTFTTGIYNLVLTDALSNPEMFSRGTVVVIKK